MINLRRVLAGVGATGAIALGLLAPQTVQAAPAVAPTVSVEVNSTTLKPPAKPPTVTKANTAKARALTSKAPHKVPNAGGVTTQAVTNCAAPPCYFYAGGRQDFTTVNPTGVYANKMVDWSYTDLTSRDNMAHNVSELAVIRKRASNLRDIVEIGTVSDRDMSPLNDDEPRMFVFAWINGTPYGGYNAGFVNYTGANNCAYHPGDNMGAINGTAIAMGFEYTSNNWWASIGGKWCGYFPADPAATSVAGNLWYGSGANFASATQIQAFGEVTSAFNEPCTDMGNGGTGTDSTTGTYSYNSMPTYWASTAYSGPSAPAASLTLFNQPAGPPYDVKFAPSSVRTIFYGGKGWGPTGGTGTRGSC